MKTTMKIYTISEELLVWDNEENHYRTITSLPRVKTSLKGAKETMDAMFLIVNKANCKGTLKPHKTYKSEDNTLRTYYFQDDNNNYKVSYTIYAHEI